MSYIVCNKCLIKKLENDFSFRNIKTQIRHKICKICHAKARKTHYIAHSNDYKVRAKIWAANNKDLRKAISAASGAKCRATNICTCCTQQEIINFYLKTPKNHVVDHIKRLSKGGIHCLCNMQYLTSTQHGTKSNLERWYDI